MKNKELYIKAVFWTLWSALVITCVYYIVYNAQLFISDDAIVIRHTGFGQAFLPHTNLFMKLSLIFISLINIYRNLLGK